MIRVRWDNENQRTRYNTTHKKLERIHKSHSKRLLYHEKIIYILCKDTCFHQVNAFVE